MVTSRLIRTSVLHQGFIATGVGIAVVSIARCVYPPGWVGVESNNGVRIDTGWQPSRRNGRRGSPSTHRPGVRSPSGWHSAKLHPPVAPAS